MEGLVSKFGKNAVEEVRVALTEFKGHQLIDLRVYYIPPVGEAIPTKKGLSLSIELYSELKEAILKLEDALEGF